MQLVNINEGLYKDAKGKIYNRAAKGRVQLEPNYKLVSPMAGKVNGKWVNTVEFGKWYQADENPDLALVELKKRNDKGKLVSYYVTPEKYAEMVKAEPDKYNWDNVSYKFKLDKGKKDDSGKKSDIYANYNPYWHTSYSWFNDQFTSAWNRSNLVKVEVEIPKSELTSGYKAKYANDSVGAMTWYSGPVSTALADIGKPRIVVLSRYNKILRIVPDSEVAENMAKQLEGTNIEIPENTITPRLKRELEKRGVKIGKPQGLEEADVKKRNENIEEINKNALAMDKIVEDYFKTTQAKKSETLADILNPANYKGKMYSVENLIAEVATKLVKWGINKTIDAAKNMMKYMLNAYHRFNRNYNDWKNEISKSSIIEKKMTEEQLKEVFADIEKEENAVIKVGDEVDATGFDEYLDERAEAEGITSKEGIN